MISLTSLLPYFPYSTPAFQYAAASIILAPLIWNLLARFCRVLTAGKSRSFQYGTCYVLAIWIFSFSCFRDYLVQLAMTDAPKWPILTEFGANANYVGYGLIAVGQVFVWSSFLRLGITGTFLGDYCGILMSSRVTGFPFNFLDNPMYVGSTLSFLGNSLLNQSLVGLVLTAEVFIVYQIAQIFEESYTAWIYSEAAAAAAKKSKKSK